VRRQEIATLRLRARAAGALVLLFCCAWPLGLGFVAPVFGLLIFSSMLQKLDAPTCTLLLIPVALSVSLGVSYYVVPPGDRALGAVFNIYLWLGAFSYFVLGKGVAWAILTGEVDPLLKRAIATTCLLSFGTLIGGYLLVQTVLPASGLRIPTLLGLVLGDRAIGVLDFYSYIEVGRQNYLLGEARTRFNGMGIFGGEGALILVVFSLLFMALKASQRPLLPAFRWMMELLIAFALILTASRMLIVGYFLSTIAITVVSQSMNSSEGKGGVASLMLRFSIFVVVSAIVIPAIPAAVDIFLESRAGSSDTRLNSYLYAFDLVWRTNPILGMGYKPFDEAAFGIPIGSHSTPIGMMTKAGILGCGLFLYFLYLIVRPIAPYVIVGFLPLGLTREQGAALKYVLRASLVAIFWSISSDVDAAAFGSFAYFFCLGTTFYISRYLRVRATGPTPSQA